MTVQNAVRLADALNAQLADDAALICSVWTQEANTLAVVSSATGEIYELFQSPDARTLYYGTRMMLRWQNHQAGEVTR